MAQIAREALYAQTKTSPLHSRRALPLKIFVVALAIASRFLHVYVMIFVLTLCIPLLLYVGVRKVLLAVFSLWCMLASLILLLNLLFSTLTIDVVVNLIYGFTTFTALTLFYTTTSPSQVRTVLGFNTVSLTYLFIGYSVKLLSDLLDALRARGWSYTLNPYSYRYVLRAFAVLLTARVIECTEALKARGVEE